MSDLECKRCDMHAEKVNIAWYDGYTWCEVTVWCEDCEAETVWKFRDPYNKEVRSK